MTRTPRQLSRRRIGSALACATALVATVLTVTAPQPAAAATPIVVDTASALADGPDDGTSLADAVALANADPGPDTIEFAPDVFDGSADPIDTVNVEPIVDDVEIVGPGRANLTLTSSADPVLTVTDAASIAVSALTIGSSEAPVASDGLVATDAGDIDVSDVGVAQVVSGIEVTGAGVVTIAGVDVADPTGNGIEVTGADTVAISATNLTGAGGDAIVVGDVDGDVTLETVRADEITGAAVRVTAADTIAMTDVDATRTPTGADGPDAGAIAVTSATSTTVTDLTVAGASGGGLRFEDVDSVTVTELTSTGNGTGVVAVGAATIVVGPGVEAIDNTVDGIAVSGSTTSLTVDGAVIADNGSTGIRLGTAVPGGGAPTAGTVSDTEITGNGDGGIVAQGGATGIALDTTTVADNGADGAAPTGGVYLGASDPSTLSVTASTLSGNESQFGGAITVADAAWTVTVDDAVLSANVGQDADVLVVAAGSSATLTGSTAGGGEGAVSGPTAAVVSTGGEIDLVGSRLESMTQPTLVRADAGGSVDLTDTTITAVSNSAATLSSNGGAVSVVRSTVTDSGGGALAVAAAGDGITFTNATVTQTNWTDSIFASTGGPIAIRHSTVADNTVTATSGGVFRRTAGTAALTGRNSILTDDGAPLVATDSVGPAPSVAFSLVPVGTAPGGGNVATDDPALDPIRDNGGVTSTVLPTEESPAIDAGDPAGPLAGVTTDQRGYARVVERLDIGAVERQFTPFSIGIPPARLLETRDDPAATTIDGEFEAIGRRRSGTEVRLAVAGRAGIPADAKAVVVNVTAVLPSGYGFVTVHPCRVNPPLASSLNFREIVDSGNEIVAELTDDGDICLFNFGDTDLTVDAVGYVPADSLYRTLGPARLLDTRSNAATVDGDFAAGGIRPAGGELELTVVGRAGVSADADAVVVNVTSAKPEAVGFVTVHPCLPELPLAASLNFEPDVFRGNEIIAEVSDAGTICLFTSERVQLVVDVVGELSSEVDYEPVAPARLVETRDDPLATTIDGRQEHIGRLSAGEVLRVDVGGRANVPAGASGVIVNATAIKPDERGFLTIWDCSGTMPLAASLNYITGEIVGNELIVDLNDAGDFCVFTSTGTNLTIDAVGFVS